MIEVLTTGTTVRAYIKDEQGKRKKEQDCNSTTGFETKSQTAFEKNKIYRCTKAKIT